MGLADFWIPLHDLVEIAHREGPHPRPLGVGPGGGEDRLDEHAGPVDERARVKLLGKLLAVVVEPLEPLH